MLTLTSTWMSLAGGPDVPVSVANVALALDAEGWAFSRRGDQLVVAPKKTLHPALQTLHLPENLRVAVSEHKQPLLLVADYLKALDIGVVPDPFGLA